MDNFTIDVIYDIDVYDPDVWGTAEKFAWWCLGHNFDVVATILAMSSISWDRGFDAGLVIGSFATNGSRASYEALPISEDTGN